MDIFDDELVDSSPRAVRCGHCGSQYLLTGSANFVCETCGEPLNKENTDELIGYSFYQESEDDWD